MKNINEIKIPNFEYFLTGGIKHQTNIHNVKQDISPFYP